MRNMPVSKYCILFLFASMLLACSSDELGWDNYQDWYESHADAYQKVKEIDDINYTLSYVSAELMTLREVGDELSSADSVYAFYKGGMQFYLEIKPKVNSPLWSRDKMLSIENHLRANAELFELKTEHQTINPLSVNVERGNEIAGRVLVLLNFNKVPDQEFTVRVKDELSDYLTMKFNFDLPRQPLI